MATATINPDLVSEIPQGRTSPFNGGFELVNTVPDPLQPQRIPISIDMSPGTSGLSGQRNNAVIFQPSVQQEPKPENHITLACLSTLFCACPCGLISLCHAIQVNSDHNRGNRASADYNSRQAWKWGLVSVILGCLCCLIVIMYYLVYMAIHVGEIT